MHELLITSWSDVHSHNIVTPDSSLLPSNIYSLFAMASIYVDVTVV